MCVAVSSAKLAERHDQLRGGSLPAKAQKCSPFEGSGHRAIPKALTLADPLVEVIWRQNGCPTGGPRENLIRGLSQSLALGGTLRAFGGSKLSTRDSSLRRVLYCGLAVEATWGRRFSGLLGAG